MEIISAIKSFQHFRMFEVDACKTKILFWGSNNNAVIKKSNYNNNALFPVNVTTKS